MVNGTAYTSLPPPCTSTTTTTTLPQALALGTAAVLSGGGPSGEVGVRFTVNRVWTNATPLFVPGGAIPPGTTLSQEVHQIFPKPIPLTWVGIDLTVTNTGQSGPELVSGTGPGAPYLDIVVHGHGADLNELASSGLPSMAFVVGVSGCPFPFVNFQVPPPCASASGCIAIPIPADATLSTAGFSLTFATGGSVPSVALWQLSGG